MTEIELRKLYVMTASKYIGSTEGSEGHKKIINTYNSITPLPRGVKMTLGYAWCAASVSAWAVEAKLTEIMPLECSCTRQIDILRARGRWVEDDNFMPNVGDLVYYCWTAAKTGDCTAAPDHVGVVSKIDGDYITVIEGNKSDCVSTRLIRRNDQYIRGFGIPDYAKLADKTKTETELAKEWAIKNGLIKGYGNGEYGWKDNVTREQLAVILYRKESK